MSCCHVDIKLAEMSTVSSQPTILSHQCSVLPWLLGEFAIWWKSCCGVCFDYYYILNSVHTSTALLASRDEYIKTEQWWWSYVNRTLEQWGCNAMPNLAIIRTLLKKANITLISLCWIFLAVLLPLNMVLYLRVIYKSFTGLWSLQILYIDKMCNALR